MAAGNLAQGGVTIVGIGQTVRPTFYLASGITKDDVGKPVALDTTANNTVKLAGADDIILGRLEVFEGRTQEGVLTGSVVIMGGVRFTYATGDAVAVGDSIVGAGSGEVKKTATANTTKVIAKNATDETVDVWIRG